MEAFELVVDHGVSKSETVMGNGVISLFENGSKSTSSSSSSGWRDERRDELLLGCSGINGAAIARLDVARGELCAHRSGDGVSER